MIDDSLVVDDIMLNMELNLGLERVVEIGVKLEVDLLLSKVGVVPLSLSLLVKILF